MDCPEIFEALSHEKIMISRQTYDELDHKKSSRDTDDEHKKGVAARCREALRNIDTYNVEIVSHPTPAYLIEKGLKADRDANDDRIIGSYLKAQQEKGVKVLFLTADRGAKAIARSVGLETIDFDITEFRELTGQDRRQARPQSVSHKPNKPAHEKKYYKLKKRKKRRLGCLIPIAILILLGYIINNAGVDAEIPAVAKANGAITFTVSEIESLGDNTSFTLEVNNKTDSIVKFPVNFWTPDLKAKPGEHHLNLIHRQSRIENKRHIETLKVVTKSGEEIIVKELNKEIVGKFIEKFEDIEIEKSIKDIDYIETSYMIDDHFPKDSRIKFVPKIKEK